MRAVAAMIALLPAAAAADRITDAQVQAIVASVATDAAWCTASACFPAQARQRPRKPVLLIFTSPDCAPCRRVEALQRDANIRKWLANGFEVLTVDVRRFGRAYRVDRTPTHLVLVHGREVARFGAPADAAHYARQLDAAWRAAGGIR